MNRGMYSLTQAPPRYGEENEAAGLVTLTSNSADEDILLIKYRNGTFGRNPIGSGNEYGLGQVIMVMDESNGQRVNAVRFRVDGYGGVGLCDAIHVATGLNQTDPNYNPAYQIGLDGTNFSGTTYVGISFTNQSGYLGKWIQAVYPGTANLAVDLDTNTKGLQFFNDNGSAVVAAIYYTTAGQNNARSTFFAGSATTIPLLVRGAAAQTADLIKGQNSTPSDIFRVTSNGTVVCLNKATTGSGATSPAITSGTAFTPNAFIDAMVYVQIAGAASGTYTATWGPSTGAENNICTSVALPSGTSTVLSAWIPATNKMVVTVTNATITQTRVVTA